MTFNIYLASAGTGKTRALMDIVQKHLEEGVPPEKIAFLTFTRAGAQVAQTRAAEAFGFPMARLKYFRTIHSMAFKSVGASKDSMMSYERYKQFGDLANYDFGRLQLNASEGVDWSKDSDRRLLLLEQLYRQNPEYAKGIMDSRIDFAQLSNFMLRYKAYKDTNGYRDFTDLLEEYIREDYEEREVEIVCLDEMQDSSPLQWNLLFKAFRNAKHWYVAADQKQCIYGFGGASPTKILELRGQQHKLDISYRVPSRLLSFSEHIAGFLSVQDGVHCTSTVQGGDLQYIVSLDEIAEYMQEDESWFFLCRNRKFFRFYESWCQQNCVPYVVGDVTFPSMSDKIAWREQRFGDIEPQMLPVLQAYAEKGTLYAGARIKISTIHGVKGDEADNVVLMSDMSMLSYKDMGVDEDAEHRVFYVGVTRGRRRLFVVQPTTRLYYPYLF